DDLLLIVHPSKDRCAHSMDILHGHAYLAQNFSVCLDEVADTFQSTAAFDVQAVLPQVKVRSKRKQLTVIEKGRTIPRFPSRQLLGSNEQFCGFGADIEDSAKIPGVVSL